MLQSCLNAQGPNDRALLWLRRSALFKRATRAFFIGHHVRQRTSIWIDSGEALHRVGRDADPKEGTKPMSDAELLDTLEHHFPFGWIVAGLIGAGNVTATLLTLLAQA